VRNGRELAAEPAGETVFPLTDDERSALLRALYVVKDNWWLDAVEDALLARLEALADPRPATPARSSA
jgi:hypothetical protein